MKIQLLSTLNQTSPDHPAVKQRDMKTTKYKNKYNLFVYPYQSSTQLVILFNLHVDLIYTKYLAQYSIHVALAT